MVKLAKAAKTAGKPKKAAPPPPKDVEDSEEEDAEEEEDDGSEEEEVPQKKAVTPAKAAGTPGKKGATPAKKTDTPTKPAVTPGNKAAAAKNGKKAQKKDSSDEDEEEEEEEEEEVEEEEEDESEEETPPAKKPTSKKPAAKVKKPSKKKGTKQEESEEEEEEEDDGDEGDSDADMDTTPAPAKGKPAAVKTKESSDEEDGDEEMEEEEEDDDDDDDEEAEEAEDDKVTVKETGKRKKEVPKEKTPEAKKPKKEGTESFSLFVANLNAEKDFDELKDAIRKFFTKKNFTVSDVRLGQSKKFGYVDFSSEEDLEKAVELSGKKILGLETKMEKARSKEDNIETKKERNLRTVFVKNLPYSATSETLRELFENAVEVRMPKGGNGSNRGVAYIEFKSEAEAEKALEEKQGADVEGRAIVLDFTGDKAGTASGGGGGVGVGEQKVLVINNLAYSVTESALSEIFDKAVSCNIPQNSQGRAKGFAFVEFTNAEDCKEALKTHNNTEIEGRAVRLELKGAQQGGRGSGQTKTLFVRGLSEDTTEESLKDAFEGAVGARIAMDRETGSSKGFGFVDFSTVEEAKAAKEAMEDGEIDGNKVTLDFAKPKGDGGRGGFGRGGGRGFGRGRGFGGRGGGRGGGGRGGGRGFGGGYGGGRGGGGFRGGNRGKKIRFDD